MNLFGFGRLRGGTIFGGCAVFGLGVLIAGCGRRPQADACSAEPLATVNPGDLNSRSIIISPDNRRIAFVITAASGKAQVINNDWRSGEYDWIGENTLTFSPDSHHLAYAAGREDHCVVVLDGKDISPCDKLFGKLVFSADSRHLAAAVDIKGKHGIAVDGRLGAPNDTLGGHVAFEPATGSVAYAARRGRDWFVLYGERRMGPYQEVGQGTPIFSANGNRQVHVAKANGGLFVFDNGRRYGPYEQLADELLISKDTKVLLYAAVSGSSSALVRNGVTGQTRSCIIYGISTNDSGTDISYFCKDNEGIVAFANDKELLRADGVGEALARSPDGRRLAFSFRRGENWFVWADGQVSQPVEGLFRRTLVFSPDNLHTAFAARRDGKGHVFFDNQDSGKVYDAIAGGTLAFSPDGKTLAYSVAQDKQTSVTVGRKECSEFGGAVNVGGGGIIFDGPTDLHFISERHGTFYLVKMHL